MVYFTIIIMDYTHNIQEDLKINREQGRLFTAGLNRFTGQWMN